MSRAGRRERGEPTMRFGDRREAGRILARELSRWGISSPTVIAIARGGALVGEEVAAHLQAPLDVMVVRKIAVSDRPDADLWAVVEGDPPEADANAGLMRLPGVDAKLAGFRLAEALDEIRWAETRHRRGNRRIPVKGRHVILVDDGIATGLAIQAAIRSLRRRKVGGLIVAAPVASAEAAERVRGLAEEVLCLRLPGKVDTIASHYRDFSPVSGRQVDKALWRASAHARPRAEAFV